MTSMTIAQKKQSINRAFALPAAPVSRPHLSDCLRALQASFAAMTAIAAFMALPRPALAGPTGGTVVDGSAVISQAGSVTNINQSTNRAIINWRGFSIGLGETVNFYQPSSTAVTLNRVIGNETSVIAGALNANGQVFIVNSAGVLFTKDAQVNVGGLVASTLDVSNKDFMAGNYSFSGSSTASVVNQGNIQAREGGYVALLGKTVANEGVITATLGSVALASGDKITLDFEGNSLVDVTIDRGTLNALVENKGAIRADGGRVVLTAKAADAVLSAQVNNAGLIQARTMADLTGGSSAGGSVRVGSIKLLASGGTTKVAGVLDASAPKGGKGGAIETSGAKVTVADGAMVTTKAASGENGTWLIDPDGFTIGVGAFGGRFDGDISAATLGSLLGYNNITLQSTSGGGTDGDINVNAAVTWAADTILTLDATNDINVNAPITATGASAGLVLNYGGYAATGSVASGANYYVNAPVTLSGAGSSLKINGNAYTLIRSMRDLAAYSGVTASGYFALAQDLDASGVTYNSALIGTLTGTLAGLGHAIGNLTIANTGSGRAALIGTLGSSVLTAATVRDIGLVNAKITTSATYAAALVGLNYGTVSNAYATGTVTGVGSVGGLVATNQYGAITNSWANVAVAGTGSVGGLVGRNVGKSSTNAITGVTTYSGVISNSHANGAVTDAAADTTRSAFGGLVGSNTGGEIINSYATGGVTLTDANASGDDLGRAGGLVGLNTFNPSYGGSIGLVVNSYATGNVTSPGNFVGGLVGYNFGGNIDGSHASGDVTGYDQVGGVAGANEAFIFGVLGLGGLITNSYATGNVTGHDQVGGVAGRSQSAISFSYSTGDVTGHNQVGGVAGASTGPIGDSASSGAVTGNDMVGGVAGSSTSQISNSTASGPVTGVSNVGGIAGFNYNINGVGNASIIGSTFTGTVFGGSNVGGLVGNNEGAVSNSTFSGEGNAVGNGTGSVTGVTRLDNRRSDANAAARTAQAAQTARAATRAANVIATEAKTASATPPKPAISTAGRQATDAVASAKIDDNVEVEEPAQPSASTEQPRPRRHAAAATARSAGSKPKGAGYGATIRSIDVDGQRYELQDKGSGHNEPGQKAQ